MIKDALQKKTGNRPTSEKWKRIIEMIYHRSAAKRHRHQANGTKLQKFGSSYEGRQGLSRTWMSDLERQVN